MLMKAHINLADKKIRPLYFPSLSKKFEIFFSRLPRNPYLNFLISNPFQISSPSPLILSSNFIVFENFVPFLKFFHPNPGVQSSTRWSRNANKGGIRISERGGEKKEKKKKGKKRLEHSKITAVGVYRVYTLTDRFTYVLSAFITPRAVHARLQLRLNKPRARECVGVCNVLHRGFGQKTNKTIASALTSSSRWKTMSADKRRTLDFYVSLTLSHEITRPRAPCDLTFTPSTHPPRFDRHQYYYFPSIHRSREKLLSIFLSTYEFVIEFSRKGNSKIFWIFRVYLLPWDSIFEVIIIGSVKSNCQK